MDRGIVLLHRNIRLTDHRAIARAADSHQVVEPIFVFDPSFYEDSNLACDARIRFLHESLSDIPVTLYHGDPVDIVSDFDDPVYMLHEPTGRYGLERNNALVDAGVTIIEGQGLVYADNSRNNWSEQIESYLTSNPYPRPDNITVSNTSVSIDSIEDRYTISPDKQDVPRGGRAAALDQLQQFCNSPEYWGNISEPTRDAGLSGLSPYLRFGCLSVREVYQRAMDCLEGRDRSAFESRLYWNKHYTQKLLDWPGWMDQAVNPVLRDMGTYSEEYWTRFKNGRTGYPMIDAAVRQLIETGWLNFRNRAMLASFHGHLLNLPWKLGADWMYYHLIDADPAINYTQWQSQTSKIGTNLFRMYNPRKQVRDSDRAADWITKWVPELSDLPTQYLDQPEKTPIHVQESCDTIIGDDYPYPIVEYEQARYRARTRLEAVEQDAKRALADPSTQDRASLSRRGGPPSPPSGVDSDESTQQSLTDFS